LTMVKTPSCRPCLSRAFQLWKPEIGDCTPATAPTVKIFDLRRPLRRGGSDGRAGKTAFHCRALTMVCDPHAGLDMRHGCVTQRSPSIRARADCAAPGDCAVSNPDTGLPLLSGRVARPSSLPCAARVRASIRSGGYATFRIAPAGTTPIVTYRHSAITSLRATATIPIGRALAGLKARAIPLRGPWRA